MLSPEGSNNFFNQIFKLWVNPEIEERKKNGKLSSTFTISTCLITLPIGKPPSVKFNDEIQWPVLAKKPKGLAFKKDQKIYIHEIKTIESVELPSLDGKPMAFIYFYRVGKNQFKILFDFSPNHPEGTITKTKEKDDFFSKEIAKTLQDILIKKTIHVHDAVQNQLQKIGLWAVPSLLPYPLSKIIMLLTSDDVDKAKKTLLEYCDATFLEKIIDKWWNVKEFEIRRKLIEETHGAHVEGKYILSIHTLLPQIEGIITDWIYTQMPPEMISKKIKSKTKKFRNIALEKITPFSYSRIIKSAIDFILDGPVLKNFNWLIGDIEEAFPNRHIVEHGKYDPALFTEENSLKLFLLLDTIWCIISWYPNKDSLESINE